MMHKQTKVQTSYQKKKKKHDRTLGLGLCLYGDSYYGSQP